MKAIFGIKTAQYIKTHDKQMNEKRTNAQKWKYPSNGCQRKRKTKWRDEWNVQKNKWESAIYRQTCQFESHEMEGREDKECGIEFTILIFLFASLIWFFLSLARSTFFFLFRILFFTISLSIFPFSFTSKYEGKIILLCISNDWIIFFSIQ